MEFSLQPAALDDLELLRGFMRRLRQEDPMPSYGKEGSDNCFSAMRRLLQDSTFGLVWIIHCDGTDFSGPAGYIALTFAYSIEFGGRCAFIDELFVDSAVRGRGAGRAALQLVEKAAVELGIRALMLEVSPRNAAASRLYEKAGFARREYALMRKLLV